MGRRARALELEDTDGLPDLLKDLDHKVRCKLEAESRQQEHTVQEMERLRCLMQLFGLINIHNGKHSVAQNDVRKMLLDAESDTANVLFYDMSTVRQINSNEESEPTIPLLDILVGTAPELANVELSLAYMVKMFQHVSSDEIIAITGRYNEYFREMDREVYVSTAGIPSRKPLFGTPYGIVVINGDIFVSDGPENAIKKLTLSTGEVQVLAGSRASGLVDGDFSVAQFSNPSGLVFDLVDTIYLCDSKNDAIRSLSFSSSMVSTLQTTGIERISSPTDITYDADDHRLFITAGHAIYRLSLQTNKLVLLTGSQTMSGHIDGKLNEARFSSPRGLAYVSELNSLFVADSRNNVLRCINLSSRRVSTVAGDGGAGLLDHESGLQAQFDSPCGIAYDAVRHLYIADVGNHCIRKYSLRTSEVSTIAGTGEAGQMDDYGSDCMLNAPTQLTIADSELFVSDTGNRVIRNIEPPQRPLASGHTAFTFFPLTKSLLYVADSRYHCIFLLDQKNSRQLFVAGKGSPGFQDGAFEDALFDSPRGLTMDKDGFLYVADFGNHRIRKLDPSTGMVVTVAGNGRQGEKDGVGVQAELDSPYGVNYSEGEHALVFGCEEALRRLDLNTLQVSTIGVVNPTPSKVT
eukprot:GILJ01006927.1.p1 GENE.GILJ01006927.1~~GILJ01006927.1.p1  ORF type:complete len:634 (-),score=83.71 GILJ01006927.1:276-2177(-)